MKHLRYPSWQPSDDLPDIWLDATQTGTGSIQDTGGGSISDGETVGKWISQGGSALQFVLFGANARPTFVASGISGVSALRFNSQMLAVTSGLTAFQSMSALTILVAGNKVADVGSNGTSFAFTESHDSAGANSSLALMRAGPNHLAGGRRVQGDTFDSVLGGTMADGSTFIDAGVFDWANSDCTLHQSCKFYATNSSFQTAGNTSANSPFGIGVGAFPQETGSAMGVPMNGYVGEVLVWKNRAFTPSELVGPHAYLARKWNPNQPVMF